MKPLDPQLASIEQIQLAIGKALKHRVESEGITVTQFAQQHGIGKTSLYRLFKGEGISLANLIRILRGLGMQDLIIGLLEPPLESPLDHWKARAPQEKFAVKEVSGSALVTSSASGRAVVKSMLAKPKGGQSHD